MEIIIGRKSEQALLQRMLQSEKSEFVAVLGRLHVGKTFLINEFFNTRFTFRHTGKVKAGFSEQLQLFNESLNRCGSTHYELAKSWFESFEQLYHLLSADPMNRKKVLFLDEISYMDTPRSDFLSSLEYFWTRRAVKNGNILLIVCESACSWMVKKLLNHRGKTDSCVTQQIHLKPFTLLDCERYYQHHHIAISRREIMENYMIFGGIPFYLSLMRRSHTVSQNIDNLLFAEGAILKNEFQNLYAASFKSAENHVKIVEVLSRKAKGLTREELIKATRMPDGGGLNRVLEELELCGFIRRSSGYGKKKRNSIYQITDFYTLFYFNFLKDSAFTDEHYWTSCHRAWSDHAFEQICLVHLPQIKQQMEITDACVYSWKSGQNSEMQTTLVVEQSDKTIHFFEMQFVDTLFIIDRKYKEALQHKCAQFQKETRSRKTIFVFLLTPFGIQWNQHRHIIHSTLTLNDLFVRLKY